MMQTAKIVQAVVLLTIVALAASCATTKEYTSKIFPGKQITQKETTAVALRFLELDKINPNEDDLVTTDIIMGRDTVSNTLALDNLANVYPSMNAKRDSLLKTTDTAKVIATNAKKISAPVAEEPIARSTNANDIRTKRTREKQ